MIAKALIVGAALALLAGSAPSAELGGSGPARDHLGLGKPSCTPPAVPVWGKVSTLGAVGWHCGLPPPPNCGKTANAKWHPAQSKWTCVPCPPGEIAYTTKAPGGGTFAHCKAPPHHH